MFVGHYAPVFALKAVRSTPGLAAGFVAVQFVDIAFFSLSYFGIERWRPNPSLAGFTPIDLYFMPYTHSLIGAAFWGALAGLVIAAFTPQGRRLWNGVVVALLVVSHWFLDLIVHRGDLALSPQDAPTLGYGLWDKPFVVAPLEIGLLLAGFAIYLAATTPRGVWGRVAPWAMLAILLGVQGVNWFTPPASDPTTFSAMGLAAYLLMAAFAFALDRTRAPAAAVGVAQSPAAP